MWLLVQQVVLEQVPLGTTNYCKFEDKEEIATTREVGKPPMFDGMNYALWMIRKETYIISLGGEVLAIVNTEYKFLNTIPTYEVEKEVYKYSAQAKNPILSGFEK